MAVLCRTDSTSKGQLRKHSKRLPRENSKPSTYRPVGCKSDGSGREPSHNSGVRAYEWDSNLSGRHTKTPQSASANEVMPRRLAPFDGFKRAVCHTGIWCKGIVRQLKSRSRAIHCCGSIVKKEGEMEGGGCWNECVHTFLKWHEGVHNGGRFDFACTCGVREREDKKASRVTIE